MATVRLEQKVLCTARSGACRRNQPDPIVASSYLVGINCQLFSETHIEDPAAQFDSYVCNSPDPTSIRTLVPAAVKRALVGTGLAPQGLKKACQGVGAHLGEGVAAMVFIKQILQGNMGNFAHIKVGMGPIHRCPDFVILVRLRRLYQFYGLPASAVENKSPLPVPVEVKSRRRNSDIKGAVSEALKQLIFYWWRVSRRVPEVVGCGIVAIFVYGNRSPTLYHCFLRPSLQRYREFLASELRRLDLPALRAAVEHERFVRLVESCLEGFDDAAER